MKLWVGEVLPWGRVARLIEFKQEEVIAQTPATTDY